MKFFNRVRVGTATVGQGTITLGAAVGANMLTLAEAGAVDGDETTFMLEEGADFEISRGVVGGSATTVTRATVLVSKINGVVGTSKLELSGAGQVRFIQSANDINDLVNAAPFWQRMLEVVKTDNYTLTKADAGVALVFNKGTAITGSLPAVANSTAELYIVRCLGAGTLTIDPNGAETIEGAATMALTTGMAALIWPNEGKTAWRASIFRSADPAAARASLGLVIGTNVQAQDPQLQALAGLTGAAGSFVRWTGATSAVMQAIVGTVSQSGGDPTGALVERGSNANGQYVRFADGTQICSQRAVTTSASGTVSWSFPASFAEAPAVLASGNALATAVRVATVGSTTTTGAQTQVVTETGARIASSVDLLAVGRWF